MKKTDRRRSHPVSFAPGIKSVRRNEAWSDDAYGGGCFFSFSLHFTPLINLWANSATVCACEEMLSFIIFILRGTCGEREREEEEKPNCECNWFDIHLLKHFFFKINCNIYYLQNCKFFFNVCWRPQDREMCWVPEWIMKMCHLGWESQTHTALQRIPFSNSLTDTEGEQNTCTSPSHPPITAMSKWKVVSHQGRRRG